jgi:hypothetical protein
MLPSGLERMVFYHHEVLPRVRRSLGKMTRNCFNRRLADALKARIFVIIRFIIGSRENIFDLFQMLTPRGFTFDNRIQKFYYRIESKFSKLLSVLQQLICA